MLEKNDDEKSTSLLTRIGNTVSGVGSFLGRGVGVLAKGAVYPVWPKNWFKSRGEMWHDIKNGGRHIINNPPEEYDPPIETIQASKDLGVQIMEQKKGTGKVTFLASRTLTGDIPYLSPKQLGEIKTNLPNVTIFREENKIVIEVDVEEITNGIKDKNKGKSPEKIKELVIEAIKEEVDKDLKKLAKITGGEFKVHTDLKLLNGIAEKLYKEYDNQKQQSQEIMSSMDKEKSSEEISNNWRKKAINQESIRVGRAR
ncbi:MAG: hypothetical protein ACR5LA_06610 [Wolbachia sp.]